jgi:hypothetical protein
VILGTIIITAALASMSAVTIDPTVVINTGGVTITPDPATCSAAVAGPDILIVVPTRPNPPIGGIGTRQGVHIGGRGGARIGSRRHI